MSSDKICSVWLDCDPGHDDAFAILLAAHSPQINLLGISIVHGNDSVENCALNALRIMWASGVKGVPVFTGIQRPIIREPKFCPEIHGVPGKDGVAGMCGFHFPDEEIFKGPEAQYKIEETHGVIAMSQTILKHLKKVTVVLTGAQTNFAIALRMFPQIKNNIEKVVFMGGAIGLGNTGVAAEFNIQIDPEAASVVLHSGLPLVMIPLEVTHQVLVTPEILLRLSNIDQEIISDTSGPLCTTSGKDQFSNHRHVEYPETFAAVERSLRTSTQNENPKPSSMTNSSIQFSSEFVKCWYQLLTFFKGTYCQEFGFTSPPLHDPCTIFYLTHPEAFKGLELYVDVETSSEKCAGRTLCDLNNLSKKAKNVFVCTNINTSAFWENAFKCLKRASENSPLSL